MLFSHDPKFGLDPMPYTSGDQYKEYFIYESLYKQNIECDILPVDKMQISPPTTCSSKPPLYLATDALLQKISDFVKRVVKW